MRKIRYGQRYSNRLWRLALVRILGSTLWITSVSVLMQRIVGIHLGRHGTEWSVLFHFFYLLVYTALYLNISFPPWKHEQITIFFIKMGEVILKNLAKRKRCHHCQIAAAQDTPMNRRWWRRVWILYDRLQPYQHWIEPVKCLLGHFARCFTGFSLVLVLVLHGLQ